MDAAVAEMDIPPELRSMNPNRLRDLANSKFEAGSSVQRLLLDAAAEIEGGEDAYAVLVSQIRTLCEKIARMERNLL